MFWTFCFENRTIWFYSEFHFYQKQGRKMVVIIFFLIFLTFPDIYKVYWCLDVWEMRAENWQMDSCSHRGQKNQFHSNEIFRLLHINFCSQLFFHNPLKFLSSIRYVSLFIYVNSQSDAKRIIFWISDMCVRIGNRLTRRTGINFGFTHNFPRKTFAQSP